MWAFGGRHYDNADGTGTWVLRGDALRRANATLDGILRGMHPGPRPPLDFVVPTGSDIPPGRTWQQWRDDAVNEKPTLTEPLD